MPYSQVIPDYDRFPTTPVSGISANFFVAITPTIQADFHGVVDRLYIKNTSAVSGAEVVLQLQVATAASGVLLPNNATTETVGDIWLGPQTATTSGLPPSYATLTNFRDFIVVPPGAALFLSSSVSTMVAAGSMYVELG